jgi:hypothetical protein
MKNVIMVKKPESSDISATLIGKELVGMAMILSKPDMNDSDGWINSIHPEIIGQTIRVFPTIEKDISMIESHYHDQWKADKSKFNLGEYTMDVLVDIKESIDNKLNLGNEISTMTGESDCIEFIDMSNNSKLPFDIAKYMTDNNINKLLFKFHNKDTDIYRETVGYALYDQRDGSIECFYNPEDFFNSLEFGKYVYAGEVHVYDCTPDDMITEAACSSVRENIITMMSKHNQESWNEKVNNALEL